MLPLVHLTVGSAKVPARLSQGIITFTLDLGEKQVVKFGSVKSVLFKFCFFYLPVSRERTNFDHFNNFSANLFQYHSTSA